MVYCVRKLNGATQNGYKTLKTRNMKKYTEDHFLADVSSIQWCYTLPETDNVNNETDNVDILVEEWTTRFNFVVEKHAPMREIRVSDKYCQWINSSLTTLMKQREKLKK